MADSGPGLAIGPISLAEIPEFGLGGMRVRPAELTVAINGETRELQPRVMQVLIALAEARPAVLSRERLAERCWDGRIVGDDALNRCIVALRHIAKEFSPEPFAIETIARVGYHLIEAPADGNALVTSVGKREWLSKKAVLVALLALVLVGSTLAFAWSQFARGAEPASIAVLPFRNLANGDRFFAEGVGEEIMGQLAREPAFRVTGRASAAQFSGPSDPRKVGRALGVDYILEGSVRPGAGRVRINASLIQTSDGTRLWSETYDEKLDDILDIQSAIGQAVASGLKRKLVARPRAGRAVSGETYALYLNARGLIAGPPQGAHDAVEMLRRAIRMDPEFAPAWASLASALIRDGRTKGSDGLIAIIPQARGAVRRALQLDPNLAQAYDVSAQLVGLDSPEGISHMQRAAELAPGGAEGAISRAVVLNVSGKFVEAYAARRRAREFDPLAPGPWQLIAENAATMGDRAGAESAVRQGFPNDPIMQNFGLARVAWHSGDFSEAARRWSDLADGQSRWASPSKLSLENALFMLRLSKDRPSRPPLPTIGHSRSTPAGVWMKAPPSASEWQRRNRSSAAELVYRDENVIAAKLMLTSGRSRELVATFDSPTGLLGVRRGQRVGTCYLQNAALVALALRAVGRNGEANHILGQSDAAIRTAYRRGTVPLWFEEDAAGIWALLGRPGSAVDALDRALRRGSAHATRSDLPKLADEPALRSLRGNPRYEAVRAKYEAHYARERAETARALKISIS